MNVCHKIEGQADDQKKGGWKLPEQNLEIKNNMLELRLGEYLDN